MAKEITIGGHGYLPCLHCGKMVKLDGDIHLCNAPKNEWLNKLEQAIIQMPNGDLFDLKKKAILKTRKSKISASNEGI